VGRERELPSLCDRSSHNIGAAGARNDTVNSTMSRVRFGVLLFAFLLAMVTYLDRVCISVAAPFMMADLHLSLVDMGFVFSAFTLAYSLFEVPSGWLGDRIGPRRVLTRIVLWWSAFTMLTGAAQSFRSLLAIRFLFGAGEAGAFPNIARSFALWFPRAERGVANGTMFLGSRLGGALSAPLALLLIHSYGWRASFVAFGAIGILWATVWWISYRDRPADHSRVNDAERAWIEQDGPLLAHGATPWRTMLTSGNLIAICAMYFAFGYGLYFYFTWLPTYLIRELHFSPLAGGLFASLPFVLAGAADLSGGRLTDQLARHRGLRVARSGLGCCAFVTCGLLVVSSTLPMPPVGKALLLAFALASADLALAACWAVCLDVGASHAGVVTGFMNTAGNLGGMIAPIVTGFAVERWESWAFAFYVTGLVYIGGGLAWLAIDPRRSIGLPRNTPCSMPNAQ
jgi:MFS transporter, ACS family, glucarate transporter